MAPAAPAATGFGFVGAIDACMCDLQADTCMPLEACGPSRACAGDVLLPADWPSQAGSHDGHVQTPALTRRAAINPLAFLVEPPRGLAWRLLEQVPKTLVPKPMKNTCICLQPA